jgi:hypothetical protein
VSFLEWKGYAIRTIGGGVHFEESAAEENGCGDVMRLTEVLERDVEAAEVKEDDLQAEEAVEGDRTP